MNIISICTNNLDVYMNEKLVFAGKTAQENCDRRFDFRRHQGQAATCTTPHK